MVVCFVVLVCFLFYFAWFFCTVRFFQGAATAVAAAAAAAVASSFTFLRIVKSANRMCRACVMDAEAVAGVASVSA